MGRHEEGGIVLAIIVLAPANFLNFLFSLSGQMDQSHSSLLKCNLAMINRLFCGHAEIL